MTNPKTQAILVQALNEELFPKLLERGFMGPDLETVLIDDLDIVPPPRALLFHFRRFNPRTGRVVVTVNVKSFSRPTFQIIAGHVPNEGVKRWCPEEIVPPEKVTASNLQVQAHLQASPRNSYAPFRPSLLAYWFGSKKRIYLSVHRAEELLPDLINWLEIGTPSGNVWVVKFPRPGDKPKKAETIRRGQAWLFDIFHSCLDFCLALTSRLTWYGAFERVWPCFVSFKELTEVVGLVVCKIYWRAGSLEVLPTEN